LTLEKPQVIAPPEAVLADLIGGCLRSQAVRVTAKLGLPDLLRDGPKRPGHLAAATGAHEPSLVRLLRALTTIGILTEDGEGQFATTPMGELLRSDHPRSARAFAILMGEPMVWQAWGAFEEAILTGEPAFDRVFGEPFFAYCDQRPNEAALFNAGMTSLSSRHIPAIVAAYDFSGCTRIIDVAGGHGALLRGILERYPHATGVLCDVPSVVAGAFELKDSAVAARCEFVGVDMFEAVPTGGDTYLLKMIIHDWSDAEAIQILRNCRRVMTASGKVLVCDAVIAPSNTPDPAKWADLNMLALMRGRERTESEFRDLYMAAGFHLTRVIPTGELAILEGVPSQRSRVVG
jgi:O-methyltransferase domain/Dimerisation domain